MKDLVEGSVEFQENVELMRGEYCDVVFTILGNKRGRAVGIVVASEYSGTPIVEMSRRDDGSVRVNSLAASPELSLEAIKAMGYIYTTACELAVQWLSW